MMISKHYSEIKGLRTSWINDWAWVLKQEKAMINLEFFLSESKDVVKEQSGHVKKTWAAAWNLLAKNGTIWASKWRMILMD